MSRKRFLVLVGRLTQRQKQCQVKAGPLELADVTVGGGLGYVTRSGAWGDDPGCELGSPAPMLKGACSCATCNTKN